MISLIHPSRGRAKRSFDTIQKWLRVSRNPETIKVIVSIDHDDPDREEYVKLYWDYDVFLTSHKNKSSVEAINNGFESYKNGGDIIMVVSDDTDCYPGWDLEIIKATQGKTDWILKTQDGIQPWIITMPIMDRAYYNRFGYIYHPDYLHLFADTELTCVADILGRKITSNLLFPHNHYSIGKATLDSVYSKNDRTNEQGEKLFLERYARNFDLPKGNPILDKGLISWLKTRHVNA